MKQRRHLSPWLLFVVAGAATASVACGSDAGSTDDAVAGGAGAATIGGGSGALAGAGTLGPGGGGSAGAPSFAGSGGVLLTAGAGSGGASGGASSGAAGMVSGGSGGASASGGAPSTAMPYGPVSCLPKFEAACKPTIKFTNGDPNGRGKIFNTVIPDPVATMQDITCTVCSILFRDPSEMPKDKRPTTVTLALNEYDGVAATGGNTINFSLNYIKGQTDPVKAKTELTGVLLHESVHIYQSYGNGGLGEGMADYVRIRVGLYEPGRRSRGGKWTDAYTTSGFFFSWLAGPCKYHADGRNPHNVDIGYLINKTIGDKGPGAVPALFMDQFGKSVDALWTDYQNAIK